MSVEDAARILGISRQSAYAAAHSGQLPVIRIGRRMLVPKAALDRLLAGEYIRPTEKPDLSGFDD